MNLNIEIQPGLLSFKLLPVAWFAVPLFGPVTTVTMTFLPNELLVETHISTSGVDSFTEVVGPMLNSGTIVYYFVCVECTSKFVNGLYT